MSRTAHLSSYRGYFHKPHWKSMGLPEISRVTWQVWNWAADDFLMYFHDTYFYVSIHHQLKVWSQKPLFFWSGHKTRGHLAMTFQQKLIKCLTFCHVNSVASTVQRLFSVWHRWPSPWEGLLLVFFYFDFYFQAHLVVYFLQQLLKYGKLYPLCSVSSSGWIFFHIFTEIITSMGGV